MSLNTNSQIYSLAEYLSTGLPVNAQIWPLVAHPVYALVRPNRSVQTNPVLGLHSRSSQCWACISTNPASWFGYNDYMAYHYAFMLKVAADREPEIFAEAAKSPRWVKTMNEEMQALSKNETWDLVPHSPHKKAIGCRCIYKMNYNVDGSVNHSKSRLLAKVLRYKLNIDREPDRKETDRWGRIGVNRKAVG